MNTDSLSFLFLNMLAGVAIGAVIASAITAESIKNDCEQLGQVRIYDQAFFCSPKP